MNLVIFVRFIPKYFTLGVAAVNCIVFFVSNSTCSLLESKRKAVDFVYKLCILQPCYNHLLVSGSFFIVVDLLGFLNR